MIWIVCEKWRIDDCQGCRDHYGHDQKERGEGRVDQTDRPDIFR